MQMAKFQVRNLNVVVDVREPYAEKVGSLPNYRKAHEWRVILSLQRLPKTPSLLLS
jgi:hypothetical protein